jgi:hypothetical protein
MESNTFRVTLPCHAPPTFAAALELARQRAMLLHLDIKEPDLESDIAALLDQADAWDHVVSVNTANATNLLRHSKLRLLKYKAGLFEGRRDMDPTAVRAALPGPGEMIIVDDPRVSRWRCCPRWASCVVPPAGRFSWSTFRWMKAGRGNWRRSNSRRPPSRCSTRN